MAWVPITKPASPLAISASMARRSLVFWLPVSQAVLTPRGSSQAMSLRKCCSASISVGAINAHCQPASIATAAARAATTVLPLPTSPCSRRCIGTVRAMSTSISVTTRCCAAVSLKGKEASSCWRKLRVFSRASCGALSMSRARLLCNCDSCCASNSSSLSLCQAGWLWSDKAASETFGAGLCKNDSELCRFHDGLKPFLIMSSGGMVSDRSARSIPLDTTLRK